MQRKKELLIGIAVLAFALFTPLAYAGGGQTIALKAGPDGKGAKGEAVIAEKGDQKEITVHATGLKPNAVYTVWLVNLKPKAIQRI